MEELAWVVQITPEPIPWILFTFLHSGPPRCCPVYHLRPQWSLPFVHCTLKSRALVLVSCTHQKPYRCSKSGKKNKSICQSSGKAAGWAGETGHSSHWQQRSHLHSHLKHTDAPKHTAFMSDPHLPAHSPAPNLSWFSNSFWFLSEGWENLNRGAANFSLENNFPTAICQLSFRGLQHKRISLMEFTVKKSCHHLAISVMTYVSFCSIHNREVI